MHGVWSLDHVAVAEQTVFSESLRTSSRDVYSFSPFSVLQPIVHTHSTELIQYVQSSRECIIPRPRLTIRYKLARTISMLNVNSRGYQNINNGRDQNINNHFYSTNASPAYERLVSAVAGVGASHKAEQQFERGRCLPETRVQALGMIHDWRSSKQQHPICWLSGAAGVGKSAIAMTVAPACENEGVLASSFFFFRSDPRRNNPAALIPTIAHGLTSTTPLLRDHIEQVISRNPTILEDTLEAQFRELVVEPILTWSAQQSLCGGPAAPNIVIIDGLDECGDEDAQVRILSMIQSAYQQAPGFPLRFLICSRPESWIQEAFADEPLFQLSKTIVLDNSLAAREDIRRYFVHHFREIAASRKYRQLRFPNPWPSKEDLETLVERACGQFVYASTVIKFIQLAFQCPTEQLRIILENVPARRLGSSPYHQLDVLYDLILSMNPDHEKLLPIVAAILVLPEHQQVKTPACIEMVFGLPAGQVALTLRAMHSVLNIREWGDDIVLYHTSFRDYLVERTRSHDFHIDIPTWTDAIARLWLQNLSTRKMRTVSFDQLHGKHTSPFFTKWIAVCRELTPKPSRELLDTLSNVDLASSYLAVLDRNSWGGLYQELIPWVRTYHGSEADLDLVDRLTRKFEHAPTCFHLEWPSPVSLPRRVVLRVIRHATGSGWSVKLNSQGPSVSQLPRLTDCDCDLSGGNESHDPWHRAYQEACMQLVKALTSLFEKHARSGAEDENTISELMYIFLNLADPSLLLKHCRPDTELLSICLTFFEHAKVCSSLEFGPLGGEKVRKDLFEWIETFPDTLTEKAEALKTKVLDLPWEQWEKAYNSSRLGTHGT
ncbi:hypothetical protein PM082_011230 [Marasmius tenuissimus]|nr:hypothetical protein PM082_011230 [Marasmius tenuissimus]